VKKEVRQRERFQCASCGNLGEQYAHIIPKEQGGSYTLDNIILLCYACHLHFQEAYGTTGEMKEALLSLGLEMRDAVKDDGLLEGVLSFVYGAEIKVSLGGGCSFWGQGNILESEAIPEDPYLKVHVGGKPRTVRVDARFEGANGEELVRIAQRRALIHSSSAFDIVFSRRSLEYIHIDQDLHLKIWQEKDSTELHVAGKMYLNGGLFEISDREIVDLSADNHLSGNCSYGADRGLLLAPGCVYLYGA